MALWGAGEKVTGILHREAAERNPKAESRLQWRRSGLIYAQASSVHRRHPSQLDIHPHRLSNLSELCTCFRHSALSDQCGLVICEYRPSGNLPSRTLELYVCVQDSLTRAGAVRFH
jgi:hypothetical protein